VGLPDPLPEACPTCGTSWANVTVQPCDNCGVRGLVGRMPCRHLKAKWPEFILMPGAYPWTHHGRKGLYCMGCSFPPR
jgi:hypothetical protein